MLTVILAGGASRRMGRDKALLPWEGGTLLQALIDRFSALGPVAVSVDRPGRFPFSRAAELPDAFPGAGPLNGIVSGFTAFPKEPELLLTATDLPFPSPALARRLAELREDAGACLVRRGEKGVEPLFAVYGLACLAPALSLLETGRRSLRALLELAAARYVPPELLPGFDLERAFTNVNTQEEYEACLKQL